MFINAKEMCRMIKDAYKYGGITVIRNMGYIIITPVHAHWELQVLAEELSNKIKSCIVELAGELPVEGFEFRIEKDEPLDRDVDLEGPYPSHPEVKKAEYTVTNHVIEHGGAYYRVIQNTYTGECTVVSDIIQTLIDKRREKGDDPVEGPYISEYQK